MKKSAYIFLILMLFTLSLTSCEKKSIVKPIVHSEKPKDSLNNGGTTTDTTAGDTATDTTVGGGNTTTKTIIDDYKFRFYSDIIGDWKCIGIITVDEKGEESFTKRDSTSCEDCYTLSFKDSNTFITKMTSDKILGKYKVDSVQKTMKITEFSNVNVVDKNSFDKKYIQALKKVYACRIKATTYRGELVLFYKPNAYLVFKPKIPKELLGSWQCEKFAEITEKGELILREVKKQKCKKCFLFEFSYKGYIFGTAAANKGNWACAVNSDKIKMYNLFLTAVIENANGQEYLKAIEKVHSYTVNKKGELILYYQKKKKYLIYKPVKQ